MIKHSAGVNGSVFLLVIEIFDPFVRRRSSKCAAAKVDRFHGGWTRTIKEAECFLSGRSFHTALGVTAGRSRHTHTTGIKHTHIQIHPPQTLPRLFYPSAADNSSANSKGGKKDAKWSEGKDGGRRGGGCGS